MTENLQVNADKARSAVIVRYCLNFGTAAKTCGYLLSQLEAKGVKDKNAACAPFRYEKALFCGGAYYAE